MSSSRYFIWMTKKGRRARRQASVMTRSLCETCTWMREIVTPKGSRFLLCQLSQSNPNYPKYPPQPVVRCEGYQAKKKSEER